MMLRSYQLSRFCRCCSRQLHGRRRRGPARSTRQGDPALQDDRVSAPSPGTIKPAGWLREQLKIQAAGLSGHLDEFWPDIKNSAWIGGKAEGWERVPYWLDGMVPLAYLLDDPVAPGQGQAIRRLHPRSPAGRRLARPDRRHGRTQALRRLAALPPVQGPDPVPGGDRRSRGRPRAAEVRPQDRPGHRSEAPV